MVEGRRLVVKLDDYVCLLIGEKLLLLDIIDGRILHDDYRGHERSGFHPHGFVANLSPLDSL